MFNNQINIQWKCPTCGAILSHKLPDCNCVWKWIERDSQVGKTPGSYPGDREFESHSRPQIKGGSNSNESKS